MAYSTVRKKKREYRQNKEKNDNQNEKKWQLDEETHGLGIQSVNIAKKIIPRNTPKISGYTIISPKRGIPHCFYRITGIASSGECYG